MQKLIDIYLAEGATTATAYLEAIGSTEDFQAVQEAFQAVVQCCMETSPDDEEDWDIYDALKDLETPGAEDILNFMAVQSRIEDLILTSEDDDALPLVAAIRLATGVRTLSITSAVALAQADAVLAACDRVQFLTLRGPWKSLPDGIGRCRSLRVLAANYCGLDEVSSEMVGCNSLRILRLRENRFSSFPAAACGISSLEELDLYDNEIAGSLPDGLANLAHLRKLNISKNAFTDLGILGQCGNLSHLELAQNPIAAAPQGLPALETLFCSSSQVALLTPWLSELRSLQALTIVMDSDEVLDLAFLENIAGLRSIEIYPAQGYLPRKPIRALAALAAQPSLELISIIGTDMDAIPVEWLQISGLKKLILTHNNLTELPDWLGAVTQMEELYAWNNEISHVPDAILNLPKLRNLRLQDNPISETHWAEIREKVAGRVNV